MRAETFNKRAPALHVYVILLILLTALASFAPRAEADEFEGIIYVSLLGASQDSYKDLKYFVKPKKLRIETYLKNFSILSEIKIFDYEQGRMYTIFPKEKQYFSTDLDVKKGSSDMGYGGEGPLDIVKPEKRDNTEVIHGYTCEQWIIKEGEEAEIELWIARGFSPIQGLAGMIPLSGDVMPFRIITRLTTGEEISRVEITKLVEKTIEDNMFTVPAGLKEISLTD